VGTGFKVEWGETDSSFNTLECKKVSFSRKSNKVIERSNKINERVLNKKAAEVVKEIWRSE